MNWLRNSFAGRHGTDALSVALMILFLLLSFLGQLLRWPILVLLAYLPLILCFYRMLSRNHEKRWRENEAFLGFWRPIGHWCSVRFHRAQDNKTHRFFHCPQCKQTLRVPRGKGKIEIHCPKCGTTFVKKT
ncbi:hypothetical protein [Zongyangia hominis]|uniref:Zn-finger containing protein n=1 Tax=Zongyangia hominis TaxID=2763677 RepID=A0A926EDP3_9FIRM|nr:hypothetical protein [Zongyangia hominis]MBC8571180.1 hypothetical protein [Zongyangia hominis]